MFTALSEAPGPGLTVFINKPGITTVTLLSTGVTAGGITGSALVLLLQLTYAAPKQIIRK